jgi:hypothetical protein
VVVVVVWGGGGPRRRPQHNNTFSRVLQGVSSSLLRVCEWVCVLHDITRNNMPVCG